MCQIYNSRILTKGFYMFFKKYFLFFLCKSLWAFSVERNSFIQNVDFSILGCKQQFSQSVLNSNTFFE